MSVSRSPAPSSIDLSGVPARVAEAVAQVVAVCHEQFRSDPCPEAFEEAELRVRETMNALACELLGAVIEKRDDGASRIERDGQSWFRVAATPRTIMTSLGPLTYRRARYRSGASGSSPVPVDESLGLVDDYLTRPAAQLGLLMMGHCTAREAAAFFAKIGGMTPSVSTLQRLTRTMHERWETLGPETLDSIRDAEGVPHEAVSASVSLDGVMVPLRAGEDGRAEASWREAACGTVSFHDARGERLKTLYLGRMPESGKVTLKAQLASEVAHIGSCAPTSGSSPTPPPTIGPSWRPCPETEVIGHACEHLRSDHRWPPTGSSRYREVLRHDPCGVDTPGVAVIAQSRIGPRSNGNLQAPPALPTTEGRGRRHLLSGRGVQQDPDPAHEAIEHALADRRRTSVHDLPRNANSARFGEHGRPRRNRHPPNDHQSLCRHRHRPELNDEASAINAIRDSHCARESPGEEDGIERRWHTLKPFIAS